MNHNKHNNKKRRFTQYLSRRQNRHSQDLMIEYGDNRVCERENYKTTDLADIAALFDEPHFRNDRCDTFDYIMTYDHEVNAIYAPTFFANVLYYHMEKDGMVNELCECSKKKGDQLCSKDAIIDVLDKMVTYIRTVTADKKLHPTNFLGVSKWDFPFRPNDKERVYEIFCEFSKNYLNETDSKSPAWVNPEDTSPWGQAHPGFLFGSKVKKSKRVPKRK